MRSQDNQVYLYSYKMSVRGQRALNLVHVLTYGSVGRKEGREEGRDKYAEDEKVRRWSKINRNHRRLP